MALVPICNIKDRPSGGLNLHGAVPKWAITSDEMERVRIWLSSGL
jgi:hypothetical protein